MDILNDLTKCNFYYYILRSNKAYLIFKYLQLVGNDICLEDALVRRQPSKIQNIRFLNNNLKQQYKALHEVNNFKLNKNIDLNQVLFKYSRLGYLLVIQYLVSIGANIHAYDGYALRWAAEYGHLQVVQYLLNPPVNNFLNRKHEGVNIHADNNYPFQNAAENGHLQIVKYFVSKGTNIHTLDDESLSYIIENDHLEIVQYLISIGFNTDKLTVAQKLQFNINI